MTSIAPSPKLTRAQEFAGIDQALNDHERPYYYAMARGLTFEKTPEWIETHRTLKAEWYRLFPESTPPKRSWFKRLWAKIAQ